MSAPGRRLLVLDTSYSLEALRQNAQLSSVTCRDLGGYFERVWTVHPFATLVTSRDYTSRFGAPLETVLSPHHVFIEGKVGVSAALAPAWPLNFVLAQTAMLRRLTALVRRERIDVVRAGDPLLMGLYGIAIARRCGIPLLVRLAGNYERLRQQTGRPVMPRFMRTVAIERAVEQFVLARADVVAGVNEDNRGYAVSMGVPPERTTIFRYGNLVDPVHFSDPANRPAAAPLLRELGLSGRWLLCIGRLEAVKMPDHAVRALALIRQQGHDAALLMVGAGSMRESLQALAEQLGVASHVVFAGPRDQQWLARIIPAAAVVLSPLTGRALSEVALGGAPTVAYDADWQGELVRDGETGVLVANGDVQTMAAGAAALLADPARARELGCRLRDAALDMMDAARLDAHERRTYDALLSGGKRAS